MIVYVKSHKDFRTTHKAFAQGWEVPVMASTLDRGTVMIPQEGRKDFSGDILYFDGHLFLIDESAPNDGTVDLTVSDLMNMFAREIIYPTDEELEEWPTPIYSYGDFITFVIERYFIPGRSSGNADEPGDSQYEIPYIIVNNTDALIEFEPPKLNDTRVFKLTDIVATAKEKGVLFNFSIGTQGEERNKLVLDISSPITVPHNIVFDDGHTTLENETFSRTKVAKITSMHSTGTTGVYDESVWYLGKDGTVYETNPPQERAEGDWIFLSVNQEDDVAEKVAEKFKENISSHKIEFYSDRVYYLWDRVRFVIDGETLESSIISAQLSSDNKRYLYKCGDLATTLTEKVQKIS